MITPLPEPLRVYDEYKKCPESANTGLWYDKFCNQWCKNPKNQGIGAWSLKSFTEKRQERTVEINPKLDWIKTVTGNCGDRDLLKEYTDRLAALAGQRCGVSWVFSSLYRFVSGLGGEHPVENGFAWHHALGVPYLPGSSVKGMLRSHLDTWTETDKTEIKRIFGPKEKEARVNPTVGSVIFLDAIPTQPTPLKADVMTPHYGPYYQDPQSKITPGDWHSPVPIPFLTVGEGAKFLFAVLPRTGSEQDKEDCVQVLVWLAKALQTTGAGAKTAIGYGRLIADLTSGALSPGAGAKTAIGYGRFDAPEVQNTENFRQLLEETKKRKRQEEEDRLYPWRPLLRQLSIDAIDNWDDLKKKLLENQKIKEHQTQVEVAEAVKATALRVKTANPKKWDAERDTTVAKWMEPSGVTWNAAMPQPDGKTAPSAASTEANRVEAAGFRDFGDWKNRCQKLNLTIEQLTLPEAQSLKNYFTAWGVKDGKGDKKETWKKLNARLKQSYQG